MTKAEGPQAPLISERAPDPPAPQEPLALQHLKPLMHLKCCKHHNNPYCICHHDKDAEAHLCRTNDWMDTHRFQDNDKVQSVCLTLTGETQLWYKSLGPINVDWIGLQNSFRQQYSKIGNTREQLFHTWISFHCDHNTETI